MSNTPAISHNVQVELDDELGAQVDISGNANDVSITPSFRAGTYQVFKDPWDRKNDGGKGWKANVDIFYSVAAAEAFRDILTNWMETRGNRTLTVSIPDANTGSDEWSGEAILEGDIEIQADRTSNDPMKVSIPMGGDGALTRITIV
ncbi:MAG: hypothetical protein JXB07_18880 [Anaerolineae bacterium]|nr:hypothetical protein [Anaerolineae bacterium]